MISIRIASAANMIFAAAMLAGCQQSPASNAPEAKGETAATEAPDAKPGISLTNAKLVLPVVAGRPGAVYFDLTNGSDKAVSLVSAYLEGASFAEIHETSGGSMQKRTTVEVGPGKTLSFSQGGLHVMAFELPEELAAGGTTELTLTFADGDKISAPVSISSGGTGHEMMGMEN